MTGGLRAPYTLCSGQKKKGCGDSALAGFFHNKAAKDHTRETTIDSTVTKRTHKTRSNHEALTNQTRDT
eukprot:3034364-Prymnesium_polylepis.1